MIMPDAARYRMPWATPGESVPTKDAPQFRSGRVTHPIGHDTGWTTARSQDEVGTNSAQERQYSPVVAGVFLPHPQREKIFRVMSAGRLRRADDLEAVLRDLFASDDERAIEMSDQIREVIER